MKPDQITLVIPGKYCHLDEAYDEEEEMNKDIPIINPSAFPDENIENKIHLMLEEKGIRIVHNGLLMEILDDEENEIGSVLFKLLDIPDDEEDDDELEGIEEKSEQERDSKISGLNADNENIDDDLEKS